MFQTWSCLHVLSRLQKRRDLSVWKCRCVQRPLFCRCLWWSATVTSTVFMMITTCMREYQRHFCSVIKDLLSSGNRNSVRGPAVTRELFSLQKFIWPSVQIPVLQSHWCVNGAALHHYSLPLNRNKTFVSPCWQGESLLYLDVSTVLPAPCLGCFL